MKEELVEINSLVSFKGVIGRSRYSVNVGVVIVFALVIFGLLSAPIGVPKLLRSGVYLLTVCFALVVVLSNHVRRFRDIRGTKKSEVTWVILLLVSMAIPVFNILTLLFLLFKEGSIVGDADPIFSKDVEGSAAIKVNSALDNVAASIHERGRKTFSASEIERLHELKEKGALTEDEFTRKKEDILKGAM